MSMQEKMKKINDIISMRIKTARLHVGLSQQDVAKALNLTFQQIQKYETAKNAISAQKLWIISLLTKRPINYFFDESNTDDFIENVSSRTFLRMIRIYDNLTVSQRAAFSTMMETVAKANKN